MKRFIVKSFAVLILLILTQIGNSESEQSFDLSESWSGFPSLKFSSSEFENGRQLENNVLFFENRTEINSRPKRFINYNVFGTLNVGFQLIIPLTIVLSPATNLFNAWKYKRSRSLEMENGYYEDDPVLQPQLDRISTYFDLIKIPEPACQQRAICEFSSSPDKYYPIADIFLNQVQDPTLLLYNERRKTLHLNSTEKYDSLFQLFVNAADHGLHYGNEGCRKEFSLKCPFSSQLRLNMPLFQFWKSIEKALDIKLQDKLF